MSKSVQALPFVPYRNVALSVVQGRFVTMGEVVALDWPQEKWLGDIFRDLAIPVEEVCGDEEIGRPADYHG